MCWNRAKDASTTQSKLGFKICGMQVFRCFVYSVRMPAAVITAEAQHGNLKQAEILPVRRVWYCFTF